MRSPTLATAFLFSLAFATVVQAGDGENATHVLQGVWVAQAIETDGEPAPPDAVKHVRFTFQQETLFVRGNFADDPQREDACSYRIDETKSPMHFQFSPPGAEKPVLGIFEINGDELRICLHKAGGAGERPGKFATAPDSRLVLMTFKKDSPR